MVTGRPEADANRHDHQGSVSCPGYTLKGKRIWVAGHRGMWSAPRSCAVWRARICEVLTVQRAEIDLRNQASHRGSGPSDTAKRCLSCAAASVGGILETATYPADFLYDNLMIEANIIEASHRAGVEKLLFLGSSCIYPKFAEQARRRRRALLSGALRTDETSGTRSPRIAGMKMAQAYLTTARS